MGNGTDISAIKECNKVNEPQHAKDKITLFFSYAFSNSGFNIHVVDLSQFSVFRYILYNDYYLICLQQLQR